ncbi:MAG: hypothetical protein ACLFR0_09325 [Alphaproteobacteria bacterium]
MNRREFFSSALAACFSAANLRAEEAHPFSGLIDINTGQNFRAQNGVFNLTLFMTAQQYYDSCGGSFIGVRQVVFETNAHDRIQPLLIMPRVTDQIDPSDLRNLARAQDSDAGFKILTGDLESVMSATNAVDGAFFNLNGQGKVSDHTLNAFLMTPSGNMLINHLADDYFTYINLVERVMQQCKLRHNRHLCL